MRPPLVLAEPLSLWGGIDVRTGRVIDRSHPDLGRAVSGCVLVMPGGRGSSSSASILAEAMRLGTAPAGIILTIPDPILTVGALVAGFLYDRRCPIVLCADLDVATGDRVRVRAPETGPAEVTVERLPLLIEFAPHTSLVRERDRPHSFRSSAAPAGAFVVPGWRQGVLPTDPVVYASDDGGSARVGFSGMSPRRPGWIPRLSSHQELHPRTVSLERSTRYGSTRASYRVRRGPSAMAGV